jgi:glucosamine--fructose-6-phosphate aminotransferase (isomerizing)
MSDDRFIPYRDAMSTQAERLDAVVSRVREQLPDVGAVLSARRPVFLGIGASLAAAAAPVHALRARGVAAHRSGAGDLPAGCPPLGDVVVAISQSGRSRETVEAVEAAQEVPRAAVVNVPGSPLTRAVSTVIDLGDERDSKASTIGFTGTLGALGLMADAWTADGPAGSAQGWTTLGADVHALEQGCGRTIDDLAALVAAAGSVDVSGEQASVVAAEEGALLLREVCRVPATAFEMRNYLHGPTESASAPGVPASTAHVLLGTFRTAQLATQLAEQGHAVGLVTPLSDEDLRAAGVPSGVVVLRLPQVGAPQRAVLETVVFQHLSLTLAEARGIDADEFAFSGDDTKLDEPAAAGSAPR